MTYIPAGTTITFKYDPMSYVLDFVGVAVQALDAAALRDEYVAEFPDDPEWWQFADWLVNTKQVITPIPSMQWIIDLENIQVSENRTIGGGS